MKKKRILPVPNELDYIERAAFSILKVPFNTKECIVKVRRLTYAQVKSCGDFSLIQTFEDKILKQSEDTGITYLKMMEYSELQYNVLNLALVYPTYTQIMAIVKTNKENEIEEQFKTIQNKIDELEIKNSDYRQLKKLREEYAKLEMIYRYILPTDFVSFLFSYALALDESDIELVTEDMLYEAAVLALRGHDNPADHCKGLFTDFNKEDINKRAWLIHHERTKEGN